MHGRLPGPFPPAAVLIMTCPPELLPPSCRSAFLTLHLTSPTVVPSSPSKMVTTRSGTRTGPDTGRGGGKSGISKDLQKAYLFSYNVASALAWLFVLERVVRHMGASTSWVTGYICDQRWRQGADAGVSRSTGRSVCCRHTFAPNTKTSCASFSLHHPAPRLFADSENLHSTRATTMDADIGFATRYIQTAALLEVLHVLLGLVRSSFSTTLMQVSSRIFLVWGVCWYFPAVRYFSLQ